MSHELYFIKFNITRGKNKYKTLTVQTYNETHGRLLKLKATLYLSFNAF